MSSILQGSYLKLFHGSLKNHTSFPLTLFKRSNPLAPSSQVTHITSSLRRDSLRATYLRARAASKRAPPTSPRVPTVIGTQLLWVWFITP